MRLCFSMFRLGRDLRKESCYRKRHEKLLNRLRDHGYSKMIHKGFVRKMVDKYGTINATPSKKLIKMYGQEGPKLLDALLGETTANKAELVNTLVLLDCLRAVASLKWLKWRSLNRMGNLYISIFCIM